MFDARQPLSGVPGFAAEVPAAHDRTSTVLEISNAYVRLMKAHYGKGPTSVKTHLLGDAVVVISKGGLTQVEQTLRDHGRGAAVVEQRHVFHEAMSEHFKSAVGAATGREVLAVLSATHVNPDLTSETFVLAPADG